MGSALMERARLDEIQNQRTTTNTNYIQNFISIKKKLCNKVKIASNKTETQETNLDLFEISWDQSLIGLGNNKTKEQNHQIHLHFF